MLENAQPAMALQKRSRNQPRFPPLRSGTLQRRFHQEPSKASSSQIQQEFAQLEREYRNYEGKRKGPFKGRSPIQQIRKTHGVQVYKIFNMPVLMASIYEAIFVQQSTKLPSEAIAKIVTKNLKGAGYKI